MNGKAYALERFRIDTAEHQLEILLDQGAHRHLRVSKPGTSCYAYNIVTWPGYLAVSGDMGGSIFTRLPDMFEFFRPGEKFRAENPDGLYINQSYWAEKLHANDGDPKRYDTDLLRDLVKRKYDEYIEEQNPADVEAEGGALWDALQDQVLGAETIEQAINAMASFDLSDVGFFDDFEFPDAWEHANALTEYDFSFTWRLYAIAHAIQLYDSREPDEAEAP